VNTFIVQGVQSCRQTNELPRTRSIRTSSGSTRSFGKESPGAGVRIQTTGVRLRDLACDLEQSLTVSFIFDDPGLDLWDELQLGYVDM